jgi:tRNA-2-methylthio-N6-dimethylallyladenosine synthase
MPGKPSCGKLYIKTHGCQMNEYDSAKMADVLGAAHGLELTEDEAEADVILINTCSIREKARRRFSAVRALAELKQHKASVVIGVGGCVASQEGEAIVRRAPHRRSRVRPADPAPPAGNDRGTPRSGLPQVDISFPEIEKFDRLPEPRAEGPTAFVSIMEGCSKYCSFCVVPYTRGEEDQRDRSMTCWLEVAQLADQGVREVNLARAERQRLPRPDAWRRHRGSRPLLIHALAEIDGIGRIRYTTSHPLEFSDSLIAAHRDVPKLANFLHLPVQSGSDRILAAMKRNYTALEYKARIRKLRAVKPGHLHQLGFHRRLPGRNRRGFRGHDEARRGRRLRPEFQLHLFRASGNAGRQPAR